MTAKPVYTAQQMAGIDLSMIDELQSRGATKIAFHETGTLASVEFGPDARESESQHEASTPAKETPPRLHRRGLVPRVDVDEQ